MTSVAIMEETKVIASGQKIAPQRASGAVFQLLEEIGDLGDIEAYGADVGPGSFTGVKVGVTIAKMLAFARGKKVAAFSAFDLISAERAGVPSRKGNYLLKGASEEVLAAELSGAIGYGPDFAEQNYPLAAHAAGLPFELIEPEQLVPNYVLEPSISKPKVAYRGGEK